jgi:uncharacterized protein (DUF427 family)
MKATVDGTVIADATDDDIIKIEGNAYFPPSSLTSADAWQDSDTPYTCPWKGVAQYHSLRAGSQTLKDAAWSYPKPDAKAIERVGRDFSGYLAFDKAQVKVG